MYNKKPEWLKVRITDIDSINNIESLLSKVKLNTVCQEANCPNRYECFGKKKTATFMILGRYCTRNCRFCNVEYNKPEKVDPDEPVRLAETVKHLGLKHAVITSVTRDDLEDGGAGQFVEVIKQIKKYNENTTIEVLIPDLKGDINALRKIIQAKPDIINHNIETIERLYPQVRPDAIYSRSLDVIRNVKDTENSIYTKSGIMVGLGETKEEVINTLKDLVENNCDILTIGQYLQPTKNHYNVKEYINPDTFKYYEEKAYNLGFKYVASSPLVRSSYNADLLFDNIK